MKGKRLILTKQDIHTLRQHVGRKKEPTTEDFERTHEIRTELRDACADYEAQYRAIRAESQAEVDHLADAEALTDARLALINRRVNRAIRQLNETIGQKETEVVLTDDLWQSARDRWKALVWIGYDEETEADVVRIKRALENAVSVKFDAEMKVWVPVAGSGGGKGS